MKLRLLSQNPFFRLAGLVLIVAALFALVSQQAAAGLPPELVLGELWQEVDEASIGESAERLLNPDRYRVMALDNTVLQPLLRQAPLEFTEAAQNEKVVLSLPLPDGGYGRFRIVESPIMAPELAAKYPWMKTYAGRGLDDLTATVRLDWTQFGFHAMILSSSGAIYIDPYSYADTRHYLVYHKQDYPRPSTAFIQYPPVGDNSELEALVAALRASGQVLSSGDELRTYRLAVAATGEYTLFHGDENSALAAIVTAMNRVNGIYERDVAIRMELIANNDLIIYTDPNTDPYTNENGGAMLGQNQANLDAVIGNANYDIGHVFSTGGGGIASLGVPCRTGFKARGVTGLPNPIGDPFYVDYVAHEMGHQWGANHTFNGNANSCSGGNRHGPTAYEPGSGTTIMAYAGICGAQNIQPNSDDDFHGVSFDEIRAYSVMGQGNGCAVITNTGNSAPIVNAGSDYTIPLNTPFILTGTATDPEGDTLTYDWEQFDLGAAGHPNTPVGNAPIFRSFLPSPVPYRIFPQITDIVNNTQTIGEILPSYARVMNFRLTVRDNNIAPSAGGVDYDMMQVTATDQAGPFLVTAPNTGVTWNTGNVETVTWNVANTDQPPVNCANVDIRLSTDGGYTYPVTILANTPNDGTQNVIVPFVPTTQARVQVICSDNIFFDISNTNFTIVLVNQAVVHVDKSVSAAAPLLPGDPLTYTIAVSNTGNLTATTTVTDDFPAGVVNPVCNGIPGNLNTVVGLNPMAQATFECTAEVEPTLAVEIDKTVDQEQIIVGTAVTYTITITNPNAVTLSNVLVADPGVVGCAFTPITLAPGAGQTYVCANNIINNPGATVNTATVTAEIEMVNVATASAPEAPNSPVSSAPTPATAHVAATATATLFASQAILHVDKTVSATEPLLPGETLTYTIMISNTGDITATTTITDNFPAGITGPVCNDVPGDLNATFNLAPGASQTYVCTAEVDSALTIEIEKVADQQSVAAGTAVTYTITITNANAVTLSNVLVADPGVVGCTFTPITLAPGASQTYVCADNIINSTTTNTATVTAEIEIVNTATADAPEAPDAPVNSPPIAVTVNLSATASATVTVSDFQYHVFLPIILRQD